MHINVNDKVRVKLTEQGRRLHRKDHEREFPGLRYAPPVEDSDGWSEWQLWELMHDFGRHMFMGDKTPFETGIEIVTKEG